MSLKARYHHDRGEKAIRKAIAEVNQRYGTAGPLPEALAKRGTEVISQASEVEASLRNLERELNGDPVLGTGVAEDCSAHRTPILGRGWFWWLVMLGTVVHSVGWLLVHWTNSVQLAAGLLLVGAVAGFAGPIACGCWIGQRLVERNRMRQADLLGWSLVLGGSASFAWFASQGRAGHWDPLYFGAWIGLAGTFSGLALLLFGLGTALRHGPPRGSKSSHHPRHRQ